MYIYSVSQVLGMSESHPDSVLSLLCKERGTYNMETANLDSSDIQIHIICSYIACIHAFIHYTGELLTLACPWLHDYIVGLPYNRMA